MPYVSDWTQPAKLGKSLGMPFWGNLKPVIGVSGGDFTCAAGCFSAPFERTLRLWRQERGLADGSVSSFTTEIF